MTAQTPGSANGSTSGPPSTLTADLTADLTPVRISEIVLKTSRYEAVRDWYMGVFGLRPFYERTPSRATDRDPSLGGHTRASEVRLCFMRLHMDYPYSQILAIFEDREAGEDRASGPGLHHMQFRHPDLDQVFTRFERLRDAGLRPFRTANHGPGTSFYYRDPDGNVVELSGPNFATETDYLAFMKSETFRANPSGIDVDPDDFVARYRNGVPADELVRIPPATA